MLYNEIKSKIQEIKELVKLGIVSTKWITYIDIFEEFSAQPQLCAECRYEILADKYGYKNSDSIKKIILKLKK